MKKKLKLNDLKVKSFITDVRRADIFGGGVTTPVCSGQPCVVINNPGETLAGCPAVSLVCSPGNTPLCAVATGTNCPTYFKTCETVPLYAC